MAIGPLNIDVTSIPQIDIGDYVPDIISPTQRQPIIPNLPRAASAIESKYAPGGYFDKLVSTGTYAPHVINALRNYDQSRVAQGQAPLSEAETTSALQAATTGTQVTPERQRSLFNLPGNLVHDTTDILKSIPRLPGALFNEVKSLPTIGQHLADDPNLIHGLATAPGLRMIPGAFIAANLSGGTPGELLRHPLFTGLDLLPAANELASGTKLARTAEEAARAFSEGTSDVSLRAGLESQRLAKRPLKTLLTHRLDEAGNIERNTVGELSEMIKQTKGGRYLQQTFGQQSRDAMYASNMAVQRTNAIMNGELTVPNDVLSSLAPKLTEYQAHIDRLGLTGIDQQAKLHDILTSGGVTSDPVLNEAVELTRQLNSDVATAIQQSQQGVMFNGELYDLKKGMALREQERLLSQHRTLTQHRGALEAGTISPELISPEQVIGDQLNNLGTLSGKDLTLQHNILIRKLRAAGVDTSQLSEAWQSVSGRVKKVKGRTVVIPKDPAVYENVLRQALADPKSLGELPMTSIEDTMSKLKSLTQDEATRLGAKDITFGILNRNFKSITKGIEQLRTTSAWDDTPFITRLREMRDSGDFINRHLSKYTEKSLLSRERAFNKFSNESVPARFLPEVGRRTIQGTKEKLIDINGVDQAAEINRLADLGMWSEIPGFTDKMYRTVQREAATQWQTLRDQGFDPVYVHTVTPNKANAALNSYATIVPKTASAVKARAWDMAPTVKNVSLAMSDEVRQLISKQNVELSLKDIMDRMGETETELRNRYQQTARSRTARNPSLDFEGHLQNVINENYTRFNPETQGYSWGSPYLKKLAKDEMFIPVSVAKNLKALAEPTRILGGVLDPVTNAFRIATTSLSLRTQLYNIFGNGIAAELQNPGVLLRSGAKAREWIRNPEAMPEELRTLLGLTKQGQLDLSRESMGAMNEGVYAYLKGKTLGRMLSEDGQTAMAGGKLREGFKTLTEKSFALNSKFDDFYRMTNYIDEYDRAIRTGSNVADAERKAIVAVRQNVQDWMSATPIERSVIRSIIPFYGYMGHAMRFVLRYPFDHPLRTEMISKLAKTEMDDSALPSRFLSMLFLGHVGANGEQTAINAGPFNPFGDIANYMTIQGLLGATNPVIQTILSTAGIDNGQAELYPSLRYDSETGRLTAAGKNPFTNLLQNTIPQSQLITALLGVNSDYKDMSRRDPAAAMRYLASGLTIPIAWRQLNVDQEQIKAELARQDAEAKVKSEALKTGNWSEALQYPSLVEYLRAVDSLTPEQRAPFMKLSAEQQKALTGQQSSAALPNFKGVQPLETTIQSLLTAQNPILAANSANVTLPGSSVTNTTGGI